MEQKDDKRKKYNFWLLAISLFLILFVLSFQMHPIIKFAIFSVFSYIFGILLSVVKEKHNEEEIQMAIQGALSVFGAMLLTALGLLAGGIRLGYKFGIFLFFALLALIIVRFFNLFSHNITNRYLSIFSIVLFSFYILYDTHMILQRNYNGDFISASMAYYLDILNIFTNILGSDE
jgi:FtsH-binding integral membrane protein